MNLDKMIFDRYYRYSYQYEDVDETIAYENSNKLENYWEYFTWLIVSPAYFIHEMLHYTTSKILGVKGVELYLFAQLPCIMSERERGWKDILVSMMPTIFSICCFIFFPILNIKTLFDFYILLYVTIIGIPSKGDLRCFDLNRE